MFGISGIHFPIKLGLGQKIEFKLDFIGFILERWISCPTQETISYFWHLYIDLTEAELTKVAAAPLSSSLYELSA